MQTIKFVVVGDKGIGGISMLISYTTNKFPKDVPTVFDNYAVTVMIGGDPYTLGLSDCADRRREHDRLRPLSYPQTDVFLVCFSVVSPASLESAMENWVPEITRHCRKTPFLLVGLQQDLRDDPTMIGKLAKKKQKPVTYDEGVLCADRLGAVKYVECSALTQKGLKDVFDGAILAALEPPVSAKKKRFPSINLPSVRMPKLFSRGTSPEKEAKKLQKEEKKGEAALRLQEVHAQGGASDIAKIINVEGLASGHFRKTIKRKPWYADAVAVFSKGAVGAERKLNDVKEMCPHALVYVGNVITEEDYWTLIKTFNASSGVLDLTTIHPPEANGGLSDYLPWNEGSSGGKSAKLSAQCLGELLQHEPFAAGLTKVVLTKKQSTHIGARYSDGCIHFPHLDEIASIGLHTDQIILILSAIIASFKEATGYNVRAVFTRGLSISRELADFKRLGTEPYADLPILAFGNIISHDDFVALESSVRERHAAQRGLEINLFESVKLLFDYDQLAEAINYFSTIGTVGVDFVLTRSTLWNKLLSSAREVAYEAGTLRLAPGTGGAPAVGDEVSAYSGFVLAQGVVSKINSNGTYSIQFDDGDMDLSVKGKDIIVKGSGVSSSGAGIYKCIYSGEVPLHNEPSQTSERSHGTNYEEEKEAIEMVVGAQGVKYLHWKSGRYSAFHDPSDSSEFFYKLVRAILPEVVDVDTSAVEGTRDFIANEVDRLKQFVADTPAAVDAMLSSELAAGLTAKEEGQKHFQTVAAAFHLTDGKEEVQRRLKDAYLLKETPGHSTAWHDLLRIDAAGVAVSKIIRLFPKLETVKDGNRNQAYSVATASNKTQIDDAVQFCGRFKITSTRKEHESATCIVLRAHHVRGWLSAYTLEYNPEEEIGARIVEQKGTGHPVVDFVYADGQAHAAGWVRGFKIVQVNSTPVTTFGEWNELYKTTTGTAEIYVDPDDDEPVPVVIKMMKDAKQYRREVDERKVLDSKHCIGALYSSDDAPEKWAAGVAERGFSKYIYGIVMPAAERNLLTILVQERVTFEGIRSMLFALGNCLQHMHTKGKIHGDVKPLNIVRTYEDEFKLIDFDATVEVGKPIGAKASTAYIPPELVTAGRSGEPVVKSEANFKALGQASAINGDVEGSLGNRLLAHPTFDVWSYAVIAYQALTRELLFKSDVSDNCTGKELSRVMGWNLQNLEWDIHCRLRSFLMDGHIQLSTSTESGTMIPNEEILQAVELMTWMLQPDPLKRPQSFAQILSHPYFGSINAHAHAVTHPTLQFASTFLTAAALGDSEKVIYEIELCEESFDVNKAEPLLGKTAMHLAAEYGHSECVSALVDGGANTQIIDLNNNTPLLSVLALHENSKDGPSAEHMSILNLLINKHDMNSSQRNTAGQTALDSAKSSKWPEIRRVAAQVVAVLLSNMEPFDPDLFKQCWMDPSLTSSLQHSLQTTLTVLMTLPITSKKIKYLKEHIIPLDIWDDHQSFANLQKLVKACEHVILSKACAIRDEMIRNENGDNGDGESIGELDSIVGGSPQVFNADVVAAFGMEIKPPYQNTCESNVCVPLLHLMNEQAAEYFESELKRVFPGASYAAEDSTSQQVVCIARAKGEPRMGEKVLEYRAEDLLDQCKAKGIEVQSTDETDPDALHALLMVHAPEVVAAATWHPSSIAQVRDCLRCTVDCATPKVMWKTFCQMQTGFKLKEGNGRLKNNMNPRINSMAMGDDAKPPDILANVILAPSVEFGISYSLVVEVQIHLREINELKHQNHILYKIRRAESAAKLRDQLRASALVKMHNMTSIALSTEEDSANAVDAKAAVCPSFVIQDDEVASAPTVSQVQDVYV